MLAALRLPIISTMSVVTEADAAAIRTAYEQDSELSAAIELRRRFPGIADNAKARQCALDRRLDRAKMQAHHPVRHCPAGRPFGPGGVHSQQGAG
nr:hypothetical protein [uncultured Rhodopila sp.]